MDIEHYKQHHAITEQGLGTIHILLKNGDTEKALVELENTISKLDDAEAYFLKNGTSAMIKVVESDGNWKKSGGLYRHWKYGHRNLRKAFELIMRSNSEKS